MKLNYSVGQTVKPTILMLCCAVLNMASSPIVFPTATMHSKKYSKKSIGKTKLKNIFPLSYCVVKGVHDMAWSLKVYMLWLSGSLPCFSKIFAQNKI